LAFLIVVATFSAALADVTGMILCESTGLVIAVPGGSANQGVQLAMWRRNGTSSQTWKLAPTDSGWFKVVNVGSGLCMGVDGGSIDDGARIILWTDNQGSVDQQWRWERFGDHRNYLVNRKSGKVVDVVGESTSQGTRLCQYHKHGSQNQGFWFTRE
jgi:hypothetical protein